MGGDIRSRPELDSRRGSFSFRHKRKYKCNKRCPFLTTEHSCKCPNYLRVRYRGKFGEFVIIKGKFGDGCPIYKGSL